MTVLWDGPAPQPANKAVVSRRFERVSVEFPVTVYSAGRTYRGRSLNLGEGGIDIVCPVPLGRGQEISLTFTLPNDTHAMTVTAVVRHASGFQHGCEFWSISPDDRQTVATFVAAQSKQK